MPYTLLDIRQQFIKLSGRADLATTAVSPNDTDAGADFFINNGSRWLDLNQEHLSSVQWWQEALAIGEWYVDLSNLRVPMRVWFANSEGVWTGLKERHHDWLVNSYPNVGDTTPGTPAYWASFVALRAPAQKALGIASYTRRIAIMPPTSEIVTLNIYGRFYQAALVDNTDDNFWVTEHPDVLVLAALMSLEAFYRNTQGVADYRAMIQDILIGIDRDSAESDEGEVQQMEG